MDDLDKISAVTGLKKEDLKMYMNVIISEDIDNIMKLIKDNYDKCKKDKGEVFAKFQLSQLVAFIITLIKTNERQQFINYAYAMAVKSEQLEHEVKKFEEK